MGDMGDTARANYQAARYELVERVRLRDLVLIAYLAVVGTIFGISYSRPNSEIILLSLPFIALGCSIIVSQHNRVIGTLLLYLSNDLKPFLENLSQYASDFGSSKSFKKHSKLSNLYRTLGHGFIILFPVLFALVANIKYAFHSLFFEGLSWWFGIICVIGSFWIILNAHLWRTHVFENTNWDK